MTKTINDLGNGLMGILLDFSDELGCEPGAHVCATTVQGDARAYADIMAEDYRRNNAGLFPVPEAEVTAMDMTGGEG